VTVPDSPQPAIPGKARIAILLAILVGLFVLGKVTGWTESLSVERIRSLVGRAGPFGYLIYMVAFAAGELIHVPGVVFVAAAVLAFGRASGFAAGLAGGLFSISMTFLIVRGVGGRALGAVQRPFMKRLLAHLDDHPIRTIVLLRLVFWLAPPVNYALALSNVRFRDYFAGSALGLVLPIALIALFVERFLAWFGSG
jgi:uncharacterized membrane protein YdjX (TVP38/TMEM64 family)